MNPVRAGVKQSVNKQLFGKVARACMQCLFFLSVAVPVAAGVTMDRETASQQRGAVIFINQCMLCHEMKYLQYQDLAVLGFTRPQLEGMSRGKKLQTTLKSMMAAAPAQELFGMQPPDLSLMTKARKGGSQYIARLLTEYYQRPDGSVDNRLFPGIRMPDVLAYSVEPEPQARLMIQGQARDVASFLEWAADPKANERRRLGVFVMIYLVVLTTLLYFLMKKVWRRLE